MLSSPYLPGIVTWPPTKLCVWSSRYMTFSTEFHLHQESPLSLPGKAQSRLMIQPWNQNTYPLHPHVRIWSEACLCRRVKFRMRGSLARPLVFSQSLFPIHSKACDRVLPHTIGKSARSQPSASGSLRSLCAIQRNPKYL